MANQSRSPFRAITELGALQKEYTRGVRGSCLLAGLGLAAAGAGLALAFVAIAVTEADPSAEARERMLVQLLGAGGLFVFGLVALASTWFAWTTTAALYEHGVAVRATHGVQQAAWADVSAVYVRVVRQPGTLGIYQTTHLYTLEKRNGEKLRLDDALTDEVGKLGSAVQIAVARAQFPRYWDAYMAGQRVTFGPLALDKHKFYVNDQELPWSQIRSVRIEQGSVWIEKTDQGWIRWTAVSVPDVPNLLVFHNLVGRLTRTT
ncbi:MAG: hypothetical protein IT317_24415 [Anaerolineales bacterium]|nr:hypothetical protein [Anaerolineales bacterium]